MGRDVAAEGYITRYLVTGRHITVHKFPLYGYFKYFLSSYKIVVHLPLSVGKEWLDVRNLKDVNRILSRMLKYHLNCTGVCCVWFVVGVFIYFLFFFWGGGGGVWVFFFLVVVVVVCLFVCLFLFFVNNLYATSLLDEKI